MKKHVREIFNVFVFSVAIVGMFFLYTEYNAYDYKPLAGPTSMVEPFKQEGVQINAKVYSAQDSRNYLQRNVVADGVHPVQITVQNNTPGYYGLSMRGIPKDLKSANSVSNKVIVEAIPRLIAFKVAGFFFWPLMIPGVIDSIVTFHAHAKLKKDFNAKAVKAEEETVLPYSTVHRIFFMEDSELESHFTVYLKDYKTGRFTPFPVVVNS
ncbi:MAG: hypothetical protein K940chlam2_01045 [Chlamydiae bacterium]|nr:hypothetical protein [Chlamydiota bacterium]